MQPFNHYARYYDLLYRGKDYRGEAGFVLDSLKRYEISDGAILELGSGTGRHALEFAKRGFRVHGVDLSDAMVSQARQRIPAEFEDRLRFEAGDVRTARVDKKFDAVVSLFHVVSYQTTNDDVERIFATAASHLRPGGVFLFDCWYGPAVLSDRPAVRVKRLEDEAIAITRIAEPEIFPNENTVDVNYTVQIVDLATRRADEVKETHRMRYFFGPEIQLFTRKAGLEPLAMCEWMSGQPLDFSTWSATVIARKS